MALKMEDRTLAAIIANQAAQAIGSPGGELETERAMEIDYYNGMPLGNEKVGESQVVSTDVFDAVESILPSLLKTFTATDDAVVFEAIGPEDEESAAQRTETVNHVLHKQNNGFLIFYEWIKDALINKNGVVTYWWDEKIVTRRESYDGLTEQQFQKMVSGEKVKVLAHTAYDDPDAVAQRDEVVEKIRTAPPPQEPQQMQPGQPQQPPPRDPQMMIAQLMAMPAPQLHDIQIEVTRDESKCCVAAVPPEEFGISARHPCVSIQDTPFCYQRTRKTISALREMGCPDSVLDQVGSGDSGVNPSPISIARDRFTDELRVGLDETDESMREVWVTTAFIRVDFDGDGVAELRRVVMPENTIWLNEEAEHINFAAITPIIMPHRWTGRSIAEIVMDIQYTASVLWRQMLNNLYLTNNPRKVVLANAGGGVQANLDDLMNSRVGGIVREYSTNAVRNEEVPFVAAASFPMLEHMQGIKESRTGITRYNQGLDADSLNKTAHGIQMIQSAAQQRIDLIARIMAETGFKDLMKGISYILSRHSSKSLAIKLRGKWVDVDPREWSDQFNMTINVGLGTGNKDAQLGHLVRMNEFQIELMKTGRGHMVTDLNVYNTGRRMAENMGFKHPDIFITDPSTVEKPEQPPDPAVLKIQAESENDKAKLQQNVQIRQFDAQTQRELAQIQAQTQLSIAQINDATKRAVEQARMDHETSMTVSKTGDASQQKGMELQVRELGVSYQEQLLSIKKQMDTMQQQHRDEGIAQVEGKQVDIAQGVVTAITQAMQQLSSALAQGQQQLLDAMEVARTENAQQTAQIVSAVLAPKNVSLSNVQFDDAGNVTGAQSSSVPVTMQ